MLLQKPLKINFENLLESIRTFNYRSFFLILREKITIAQAVMSITLVLGIILLWLMGNFSAKIIERYYMQDPLVMEKYISRTDNISDKAMKLNDFYDIIDLNVFNAEVGSSENIEEEVVDEALNVSIQELIDGLQLMGIYQGKINFAIIKDVQSKTSGIFSINDVLFETKAVIDKIETKGLEPRVLLRLGNETGYLAYPIDKSKIIHNNKLAGSNKNGTKSKKRGSPAFKKKTNYTKDGKEFYISSAEVDSELNNFSKLLNQARVVPFFKNGKHLGYQIKAIEKGSLYEKLGLTNYDVITKINGNNIDSPEKALSLLQMLRNEREITLNIERKGKPRALNYHIN